MHVRRRVAHIPLVQLPCQLPEPGALPELRPPRLLRLIVTLEALQSRSLVHPISLQRPRTYIWSQAAPSVPRNRPRLGKPGITTSCALNVTSLPPARTFWQQLQGLRLALEALLTPQSLLPAGAPARKHLRSVRTPGIFGACPPHRKPQSKLTRALSDPFPVHLTTLKWLKQVHGHGKPPSLLHLHAACSCLHACGLCLHAWCLC